MDFIETFEAVEKCMDDCTFWGMLKIVTTHAMDFDKLTKQTCDHPLFDHEYVDQKGPGFSGDDYHGYVYFPLTDGRYLQVEYAT